MARPTAVLGSERGRGGAPEGSGDELSKKIYQSYAQFRESIMDWSDIAERAFLNSRRLA